MAAALILAQLRGFGLHISRDGDRLIVAPCDRITNELRAGIFASKMTILRELELEANQLLKEEERRREIAVEARRQRVLDSLGELPSSTRYCFENYYVDDVVIITLAIRGIATGELIIPRDRFSPSLLMRFFEQLRTAQ